MKIFPISMFLIAIFIGACEFQTDQSKPKRVVLDFNEKWHFAIDSQAIGETSRWFSKEFDHFIYREINLPHTWNVDSGLEDYKGIGWYFKEFEIPESWQNEIVRLRFEAIYRDAKIWINDTLVFQHIGSGYTPFEVNIGKYVKIGQINTLVICVDNHFSPEAIPYMNRFDWSNDGGITRPVTLIKTSYPAIEFLHILSMPGFAGKGEVDFEIGLLDAEEGNISSIDVWLKIEEFNQQTQFSIYEGNIKSKVIDGKATFHLSLENIKPWHFNEPNLYKVRLAIGHQMILTDTYESTFGFRKLSTEGSRLVFNGEDVRLPGLEWMPGSFPEKGSAESEADMDHMLSLLKESNAVLTRFHWQQHEYILDWCDRNGMLVQEEIPMWGGPTSSQVNQEIKNIINLQVAEMIKAHYNHPSIVSWGIGNELNAQDEGIKSLLKYTRKAISDLDSSRLINYVSNTLHHSPANDGTRIGDILMWNDYTGLWYNYDGNGLSDENLPEVLGAITSDIPDMPIIISEYGLCEPVFKGGDPRRIEHFIQHTAAYEKNGNIAGLIYFSLNDYRTHMGEEGEGKYRQRVHGITDIYGTKKPSFQIVRQAFSPIKSLKVKIINGNLHITGRAHDGIPSYSLLGFSVQILNQAKNIELIQPIPDLLPGTNFNVVFENFEPIDFLLSIKAPSGHIYREIEIEKYDL